MNLKERLDRLTSISKPQEEAPPKPDLNELRRRIDRILEPKKIYQKKESFPIEKLVKGEIVSTPDGEGFQAKGFFSDDFQYGETRLADILALPTYPAHLLSKDERLKGLDIRRALFLDTETTGLAGGTGTFAFLVGVGFFEGGGFTVQQFFMRDYSEERASLSLLKKLLGSFEFLVTFNGKYYDIPLLETRFILSRLASTIRQMPNFDLLYPSRKIWKGAFENCRLVTLESRLLGMNRTDDVPSETIPYLYFDYLRTRDARKIHRVFYHNQMDILTMVALAARIHLVYHDPQASRPGKGIEQLALGKLFYEHGQFEKAIPVLETALKRGSDSLSWEAMRWLSRAFKKTGRTENARTVWEEMLTWPYPKDVFPFIELAKYHEHRLRNIDQALSFVEKALKRTSLLQPKETELLLQRRQRLENRKR
jgi:uncharacterized protein